jgi:signal transduction histidine kinase
MATQTLERLLERIDRLDRATLISLVKKFYKQKEIFEKIINLIEDGIVVIRGDGYVLLANGSAEKMLNVSHLRGMIFWKCIPEFVCQIDINKIAKNALMAELRLVYPCERFLKFYSIPFIWDGESQIICVFSDITRSLRQKKDEIEDEKVNSILLLSASVAHEIGNPLNSIGLQLELLRSLLGEKSSPKTSEALEICEQEVARLHGVIKNFLQAVRPIAPNFVDADLLELLYFTIKFLTPQLDNAGINVRVIVKNEVPVVLVDVDQIKQVFFNIIKNAMESMSRKKQLLISIFTDDDHVILEFDDQGQGIAAECMGRIFEPFYTSKADGTGLGMFIVQRILRNHGATLSIASQKNRGTSISVKFFKKNRILKMLETDRKQFCKLLPW